MTPLVQTPRFLDPRLLSSHFHIDDGAVVLDVGSGVGTFVPALLKKVGKEGQVIACDLERGHIEALDQLARGQGHTNLATRWCDIEVYGSTRLSDESVDFAVLVNTLYQLEARRDALREIARTMRSGGVVYVVDWRDSFAGIGPHPHLVVPQEEATSLFEASLFILEREYPAGDFHYGLAFRKL